LLLRNELPLFDDLALGGSIELQFPLTLVDPGEDLRFRKTLYGGSLRWHMDEQSELVLELSANESGNQMQYSASLPADRRLKRHAFRSGLEYRFLMETPFTANCRMGFDYFHFKEHLFHPEGGTTGTRLARYEYTFYGGLSYSILEKVNFMPALYIDYVSHNRLFPEEALRNDRYNGIQSKLSTALEIRFTEMVRLVINPNVDLDQMNSGGGNVQFIALF